MKTVYVLVLSSLCSTSIAQTPYVSPNAPQDKPIHLEGEQQVADLNRATAPYTILAKATYAAAKQRFLAGLPKGQTFFVTADLRDSTGRFEQVFVAVQTIHDGTITGRIWSDINVVRSYKRGDAYSLPESDITDWLITHPDGSEEGNFVGKFIDSYQLHGAAFAVRDRAGRTALETTEGQQYELSFAPLVAGVIRACFPDRPIPSKDIGQFTVVANVGKSGDLSNVDVSPGTEASRCIATHFATLRLPPPPAWADEATGYPIAESIAITP